MMLQLADFDAVTFDVYGTLIDWEPSIIAFLRRWADQNGVASPDEDLLMAFDRARAEIQNERPAHLYPEVLRRCFDRISVELGVAVDKREREAFAATPHQWPAYADSHAGLVALQAHAKIGALSNIDGASLESSCRKLDFRFDLVVTAVPTNQTGRISTPQLQSLPHWAFRVSGFSMSGKACAPIWRQPLSLA
jgi:FMN phosphatase YigB (HAD superfamily)